MDPREADLYGPRVLALLRRARKTLGEKYGASIPGPVTVEIFPRKKEFAVRTFGLPGAEGFLGVCFGGVITANSPASQGETPSNWEAVLWHEYCHVVTLNKTRNKMPRWLSEGISVYEEEKENPAWGSADHPRYRAMLLGEDFTPLSRLSSAFLAPKSGMHLQFAYFESALAVEFLVAKGRPAGAPGRCSTTSAPGSRSTVAAGPRRDDARAPGRRIRRLRPQEGRGRRPRDDLGRTRHSPGRRLEGDRAWLEKAPQEFPRASVASPSRLVAEPDWPKAKGGDRRAEAADPDYARRGQRLPSSWPPSAGRRRPTRPANAKALEAGRGEGRQRHAGLPPPDGAGGDLGDWDGLARDARRMLAVNPLVPAPTAGWRGPRRSSAATPRPCPPTKPWRSSTRPTPPTPTTAWPGSWPNSARKVEARLEVLKALEEAPRFLEAHKLLLELVGPDPRPAPDPAAARPPSTRAPSHDPKTHHPGRPSRLILAPRRRPRPGPARAADGRRPGPDPRGPRGGARLEGRRPVQGRRLHLRPGRIQRRRRRRPAVAAGRVRRRGATAGGRQAGPSTSPTATSTSPTGSSSSPP